ncbi:MAG: DUF4333 domain-containing protein [Actinomycetota bacterium]
MPSARRPRLRTAPSRGGILVLAALLGTGACQFSFGGSKLDTDKIEAEVTRGIEDQTGVAVQSVDCPDDVELEAGNTFTCTVTAEDGSTGQVDVTQQDDEGNVEWELRSS